MLDALEIKRKLFHMFALLLWLIPVIYFPKSLTLTLMLIVLAINLAVVMKKEPVYSFFRIFIEHLEREKNLDRPSIQALYGNLGIFLSFLIFDKIAIYGIVVLAVGDAFSTLIGKHFGRKRLFFNEEKSVEGSLAFFISSYLTLLLITDLKTALVLGFAGTFIEALKIKIDDNITIPLGISLLTYLYY